MCPAFAHAGGLDDAHSAYKSGDYQSAFKQFRSLARNGIAEAQFETGRLYVLSDVSDKALYWWRKAAKQDHEQAQANLGAEQVRVAVSKVDYKMAAELLNKAAVKGDAWSQNLLGRLYYKGGYGLARDYFEAANWSRKAADQGKAEAQSRLGRMYLNGEGSNSKLFRGR